MHDIIILRSGSQSQCKRFFKDGEDIRSNPADPRIIKKSPIIKNSTASQANFLEPRTKKPALN